MALKTLIQFPIFAPPNPPSPRHRYATEVRFSRWNNANAEKFIRRERNQKELEDQIRFEKRFDTAHKIAHNYNPAPPHPTTFKSTGTPSAPSQPSIPGKFSKYSKKFTKNPKISGLTHPAFRPIIRPRKIPEKENDGHKDDETEARNGARNGARNEGFITSTTANVKVDENGVVYEIPDAPFAYQYSYTETPKMKPVKIREPLVSPFGPETMGRPWTGRKPLPPSKKKLPEFDSFQLPPPHKKGVKPVQAPGPFLQGTGPKYVKSREEILGDPLTKEEVEELIKSCQKTPRQLNIGRDGLTHNMLENIHAHWKRRRVCKIKCKGVCTVDMDNVRQQLEEKTGGKIIYSKGGLIYLFRGRNYNYKTRPRFPLMLWRPVSPVYPRLIKRVPEGLTLEEATEMRKKGRNLIPIRKLAKNGVYSDLVKNVREAFEACELVRINCQGLNGSDYRKIGAKLKDLVPCVLISFEYEHILMWRGHNWKSSLPEVKEDLRGAEDSKIDNVATNLQTVVGNAESTSISSDPTVSDVISGDLNTSTSPGDVESEGSNELSKEEEDFVTDENDMPSVASHALSLVPEVNQSENPSLVGCTVDYSLASTGSNKSRDLSDCSGTYNNETMVLPVGSVARLGNSPADEGQSDPSSMVPLIGDKLKDTVDSSLSTTELVTTSMRCTEGVLLLLKQAVESGSALILDGSDLDADIVYQRATALAKSAPPGPVFKRLPRKLKIDSGDKQRDGDSEVMETVTVSGKEGGVSGRKGGERKTPKSNSMKDIKEEYLNVVPKGSLAVDELAKLLS